LGRGKSSRVASARIYKTILDNGGTIQNINSLSDDLGISYDYCYKAINDMAAEGLVEIERKKDLANGIPLVVRAVVETVQETADYDQV